MIIDVMQCLSRIVSNDDIEELVEVLVHIHRLPGVSIAEIDNNITDILNSGRASNET